MAKQFPKIYFVQQGYFILEFFIFVLTASILVAVVGRFYYPSYVERAKITEGINLTSGVVRTQFATYYSLHGKFPATLADLGETFKTTGKYTSNVTIDKGAVTATVHLQDDQPFFLTVRPALLGDREYKMILPVCGYANPPTQSVVYGENKTNIYQSSLPHSCR